MMMRRTTIAILLLSLTPAVAQQASSTLTPGTVYPVSISNLQPVSGSLAQVLLQRLPVSANIVLGGVLSGFSFNVNFNGSTVTCLFGNADPSGAVNLSCVAPMPQVGAQPAVARVNQGTWGNLVAANEAITQPLGWTVKQGNFLTAFIAGSPSTISGVSASDGTTVYPLSKAICFTSGRSPICLYYLPNAPAVSSISASFYESNQSTFAIIAAEYSGLSPTASPVDAGVAADSGYVNTGTWTTPQYAPSAGVLVLSGAASNKGTGSWTTGTGWTPVGSYGGTVPAAMLQEQIPSTTPASQSATGTYATGYQYFDSFIIAFK
jgi:hypothetical protein